MKNKRAISDMDYEIRFFEGLLEKKPDFFEALGPLGDLYTKRGFYEKGLKVDVKLSLLKPEDPFVLYNLACSYALLNDTDKALRFIKKAINCGYDNFGFLEQDPDLDNLKQDSRFQRYFKRVKNRTTTPSQTVA